MVDVFSLPFGMTLLDRAPRAAADPAATGDERALVEAARAGDGLAFRRLVEPHLGMLHRVAARVSPSLADDAVQETLTLAFEQLHRYRPDASFRAYLAAIAARRVHTLARSERRRSKRRERAAGGDSPATPEAEVLGAQAAQRIREVILAMPKKRRQAALLRLDAGLDYREIAAALDSSEGSARVLVHQALKQLREELGDLLPS